MSNKEIVNSIMNDKMSDLKELFAAGMNNIITTKLNERKAEIAQSYFGKK